MRMSELRPLDEESQTKSSPGGRMAGRDDICEYSQGVGFSIEQAQLLPLHYVRTLDAWAGNPQANSERAIAIQP